MTEIRRSANRSYGLHVHPSVKAWLRDQIAATGLAWPFRVDRPVRDLVRELLLEASQRPEFEPYAEACQAACLKTPSHLAYWIHRMYNKQKPRAVKSTNSTVDTNIHVIEQVTELGTRTYYVVSIRRMVVATGFYEKSWRRKKDAEKVKLSIRRGFPTLATALSYRDRVLEAANSPGLQIPEERVAAAHLVPLFE